MRRLVRARSVSLILLTLSFGAARHSSAQTTSSPLEPRFTAVEPISMPAASVQALPVSDGAALTRRPGALMPLYVSFASLQVLDTHATKLALGRGAVEANPVMRGFTGSPAGMLAIKAAGTVGVVWASERMWRRNKAAAVVFLVAANSAMGWVVQHNYRAAR
jgi:hypothetical protein